MTATPNRSRWLRSADPLAVRVVLVGFFAALSYAVVLVTQGVAQTEGNATRHDDPGERAVVVTGQGSVDALVARSLGAAVLAVPRTGDLSVLLADLRQLSPTRVVILGGSDSVSADAAAALTAGTAAPVVRLAGQDRYETAARAALATFRAPVHELLLVRSDTALDAAQVTGRAGSVPAPSCLDPGRSCGGHPASAVADGVPVLLVTRGGLPLTSVRALQQLRPANIDVVGDVSGELLQELRTYTTGDVRPVPAA